MERFRLDGQVAIVTGGNRGIGRGISDALAEAGANVVVANRNAEAGERAAEEIRGATGVDTLHVTTDVTSEEDVINLVDETVSEFSTIDVLVNNAGTSIHVAAEEMTYEQWRENLEVNLDSAFLCAKYAGQEMIDSGGGSIVNVSSISAFIANHPQKQVAYQASKAGMEGMKKQLASEWAEFDVRVNNINPGYIGTDLIEEMFEERTDLKAIWLDEMLMDDLAPPEDIGPLAVYLASDASSYMTGESIVIDGGYTVR